MKNTNPIFSLKNFRSFGEDGADFELAPITVLTGCNSAGKSSLVKALMLLSPHNENVGYTENLEISSPHLCLGGYNSVAHKNGKITMAYTIWSSNLQESLIVTRKFYAKRNDALNNGALYCLTIEKTDGTLVYQVGPERIDDRLNQKTRYDSIKEAFNRFYAVGCYMRVTELLPIYERRVKELSTDADARSIKGSEEVLKIVKDRLDSVGITGSEAISLWNEYDHEAFASVIKAMDTKLGYGKELLETLSDVIKAPEDDLELELMMQSFLDQVVSEVCSPYFTQQIVYINSASAQIERLYTIGNENKMCNALRELNRRKIQYHDDFDAIAVGPYSIYKPGSFLDKWLDEFKIGNGIKVKGTDQGLGLMAYLTNYKNEERLLADEGYGITQLVALLLQIDNCIPIALGCDEDAYFKEKKEVYYYKPKTICVEEPEVHLHPEYQSKLAMMFVEAYYKYNIHFIIETHSEYLIRKLQVMVADKENTLSPHDVSLNYVEKDENGVSHNRQIKIQDDGRLDGSFGKGFYDEAGGLSRQLFMLTD